MFIPLVFLITASTYFGHDITSHDWVSAIVDFSFMIIWLVIILKQYKEEITMKE
jgi:hypothetical protein